MKLGPLKLYDLLQMFEVHSAYQKAIAEIVMKDRPLNIPEISKHYQTRDALRPAHRPPVSGLLPLDPDKQLVI